MYPVEMTQPPILFDRSAILRNRARVVDSALFLHHSAADEIDERLNEVNRTFKTPAVVSGIPGPWERFGPVVEDADILRLEENAHDLIIHAMCLHLSNDPIGQMVQCRRALKPDGLFICVLLGGATLNELRSCLAESESRISGGLSPRVIPMAEIRDLGGLLQRAGFALPVADGAKTEVHYESVFHLMHEIRAMGEANALTARNKKPTKRAVMDGAAATYAETFATPMGRISATFETIFLTGWAPSQDQPQPLRPGSAKSRLADALGVPEHDLE